MKQYIMGSADESKVVKNWDSYKILFDNKKC